MVRQENVRQNPPNISIEQGKSWPLCPEFGGGGFHPVSIDHLSFSEDLVWLSGLTVMEKQNYF